MDEFFRSYFDAWGSLDPERVIAFFTDDVSFEDTTLGHRVRGTERMRRFVQASFDRMPDARFDYVGHVATETDFALEWVMQPIQVRGLSIGTLRNGKISSQRDYWDGSKFTLPES
jgi:ketosteroid isomerase-like protein